MKKNIIIAVLAVSNVILVVAFIFLGLQGNGPPRGQASPDAVAPARLQDAVIGPQEFTFRAPGRFVGDDAPQMINRALTISATFDTQGKDGVIVAQGGLAHGYVLHVQAGELLFVVRRLNVLTTVSGGKIGAGRSTVTATWNKNGELTLTRDGGARAVGLAAGAMTTQPVDGLDIGADRGAPVGSYQIPNSFGGTIESVHLKTAP